MISENRALEYKERKPFFEMITKSLLSQDATDPVYFVRDNGWFIFSSAQNMAHRLADINSNRVKLSTNRPEKVEIIVEIKSCGSFYMISFCIFSSGMQ